MSHPLRIVSIASEVAPYSISGGLAQITHALSHAIFHAGHHISVITPLYKSIDTKKYHLAPLFMNIPLRLDDESTTTVHFWKGMHHDDLPIYFVEHATSFRLHQRLYGSKYDNERFWLFNLAAIKLLLLLKEPVHLIHCHDWHAGLVPYFIKTRFKHYTLLKRTATLFTIHNLAFQMGGDWSAIPLERKDDGRRNLPAHKDHERVRAVNFAKRGILHSTFVNTVSEQYAKEILTKEYGQDLHSILKHKWENGRLVGIVNGIDEQEYNPATDPGLYKNYSVKTLDDKKANKRGLQRRYHLPQIQNAPLIGMVSRITEQKGFDLVMTVIPHLIKLDLQLFIFGGGDKTYERRLRALHRKYPRKVGIHLEFNRVDATKVYAGSDLFLMPSRFEPCGITQLESMRYGSIPVVRHIGGLVDTITNYNPRTKNGNGFVFTHYDPFDLYGAIVRSLEIYHHPQEWRQLVEQTMQLSHSWALPAKSYITLFRKAIRLHKEELHS